MYRFGQQNASVLEQGSSVPSLSTPSDFGSGTDDVPRRATLKTKKRFFLSWNLERAGTGGTGDAKL
jgi:hypothetical protein